MKTSKQFYKLSVLGTQLEFITLWALNTLLPIKQAINILQMTFDYEIFDINYDLMFRMLAKCYTRRDRCIILENRLSVQNYERNQQMKSLTPE